jgi:cellulose synthase/poly-beta-1,6-N-acetylglucosamine synthase-like glycosyltransferase
MLAIILALIFWSCAFLIAYTYVGYPVLVIVLSRFWPRPVKRGEIEPTVSLIIAAYNEEKVIRAKLENSLALAYPAEKLEILVVADGSADRTPDLVAEFENQGVRLLYEPPRRGKTAALNRGVPASRGEVVFFSDANTMYEPETVRKMVRNFADPAVGGVSGRKIVLDDAARNSTEGEKAYWGYEARLKTAESLLGSIATADGEIFAVRRSLLGQMPDGTVHDDMYITLHLIQSGYRVVYEPEAISAEHASKNLLDEFHLKVRYVSAGFQILGQFRNMFLPPRGWFALGFISHKVFRWSVPWFLLGALVSSALLAGRLYQAVFWMQMVFYSTALLSWALQGKVRSSLLYFPLYFSMVNTAALYGIARHLFGGQTTLWRKAER